MNKIRNTFIAGIALMGLGFGSVNATPLGISPSTPDLKINDVLFGCMRITGGGNCTEETASSLSGALDEGGPPTFYSDLKIDWSFDIDTLASGGVMINNPNTFEIHSSQDLLLAGTLTDWGQEVGKWDWLFDVTGGSLASDYGAKGGAIFGFQDVGRASCDPDICYDGDMDVFSIPTDVPEPGTILLMGIGLLGFGVARGRMVATKG